MNEQARKPIPVGHNFNIDPLLLIGNANTDTLSGDIRDALLTHVRSMRIPWAMLAEDEQQATIDAITETAKSAVRQVAHLVAERGFSHLAVTIGKWSVSGGLAISLSAAGTVENIRSLAERTGPGAVLVLTDIADFIGEKAPAKADKDQPELPGTQRTT